MKILILYVKFWFRKQQSARLQYFQNFFSYVFGVEKPWKCVILPSFSLTKNDLFIVSELLSENLLHVAPFSTNPFLSF